jgi:hypothetical protein
MIEIRVNRAPFLTLWATVVARRLGYDDAEALTLGRAIAGLTAQAKGRRLGIYEPRPAEEREKAAAKREEIGAERVKLMDRLVPCLRTKDGLRALEGTAPSDPESVRRYLVTKFQDSLPLVEAKLEALAARFEPRELDLEAMNLYMRLRPEVPAGEAGWGKAGKLDLERIDALIAGRNPKGRA